MRVEYHPEAAEDLNGAVDHHNSKRAGLGEALRVEVYGAIERITQTHNNIASLKTRFVAASCIAFLTPCCSAC